MLFVNAVLALSKRKRRDLLTPQLRHWYAFNGTLSGTPDLGVPRTVSVCVKLPVSSWTAAEAANLLLNSFGHIRFFGTLGLKQKQASAASRVLSRLKM